MVRFDKFTSALAVHAMPNIAGIIVYLEGFRMLF